MFESEAERGRPYDRGRPPRSSISIGIPQRSTTFGNDAKARGGPGPYPLSVDEADDDGRASTRRLHPLESSGGVLERSDQ
jgi:hypothetical protein